MYPSSISSVKFSLIQQDKRPFPIVVKTRDLLKNNRPVPDGLYSARQGTTDNNYACETCFNNKKRCIGHSAIIELPAPVINPTTFNDLKVWIKIICFECGNPLISTADLLKLPKSARINAILKVVKSKTVGIKTCPHCNKPFPKILKEDDEQNIFKVVTGDKSEILIPYKLGNIFSRVTNDTVNLLGHPINSHPRNYVTKYIVVTPPTARPEVIKLGSNVKSSIDDTTSTYQLLVENKTDLVASESVSDKQRAAGLEYNNLYASLLKGKEKKSIAGQFAGKKGLFRDNMMGKRVLASARGVIANDPNMRIDELAIPLNVAKTIQMRDFVQEYNRAELSKYVRNGPNKYPGASNVIHNGIKYDINDSSNIVLEIGDVVCRDIIDGDPTSFCRQPSLMISNISTLKCRVMMNSRNKYYGINSYLCPYFNADFDGDEMNQFVCTSVIGRNECQKLTSVPNWLISNANSSPIIGQMEDSIIGLAGLTKANTKFDRFHVAALFQKTTFVPDLTNMKSYITGHDVISILLKDTPINFTCKSTWNVSSYKQWIKFDPADETVEIKQGVMLRGLLDWAAVGKGNAGGMYTIINNIYGAAKTLEVMFNMQQVGIAYLSQKCLTIGLNDMVLNRKTRIEIDKLSMDVVRKANEITTHLENGNIIPPIGKTVNEFYEEQQMETLTVPDLYFAAVLSSIDIETNGLYSMIGYKSKGKIADMLGMISAIGLRSINGKRIAQNFGYKRTMPYYARFDTDPFARGYVSNAYISGIKKTEYIFAACQVRFDLIVKALSTSITGDQNRQSIKNLESIIINNFRWALKHNNIIQFAYGEDYLDPRKLSKVKFATVLISDAELKAGYFHADFPDYYAAIVSDRDAYRMAYLQIEQINTCELITNTRKMPVDIESVMQIVIDDFGGKAQKVATATLVAVVERFIADLPYVMLNSAQRVKKYKVPQFIKSTVFLFGMLCRIVLNPNVLERLNAEKNMNVAILNILLDRIILMYLEALIIPGTAVGNIAAQSFSEPLTQYMLDAHKRSSSGGTSKSTMNTLKEIINARPVDKLVAPSMTLPVIEKYRNDRAQVQHIADKIELISFNRFVVSHHLFMERFGKPIHSKYKHEEAFINEFVKFNPLLQPPVDLVKRCMRFALSKSDLILKNTSLELIVAKLYENFPGIYIVYSQDNVDESIIRVYFRSIIFKELANIIELRKIHANIMKCVIRGVTGIKSATAVKLLRSKINADGSVSQNENCWGIKTLGTNLTDLLAFPDIDYRGIQTTAIREVEFILGISAARMRIAIELKNLGIDCSIRHLLIYADEMVNTGTVTSIERSGIKAREPKNILLRMGYASPIATLEEAAVNNTVDELSGVTSSFLVGTVPKYGTKYNKICFNEEFIIANSKTAESMLSALL